MAISYVGGVTGTTSATLPAHEAGDLILCFAFRDGSTTAPTLVSGWTNIGTRSATSTSARFAFRVAVDGSTVSGTWTNATSVVFAIYRGVHPYVPFYENLSSGLSGTSNTNVTFGGLLTQNYAGPKAGAWVVAFAGHRSTNTTISTAPSGLIARQSSLDATDEVAHFDSGGPATFETPVARNVGGTNSGWITKTLALHAKPDGVETDFDTGWLPMTLASTTGSSGTWSNTENIGSEPDGNYALHEGQEAVLNFTAAGTSAFAECATASSMITSVQARFYVYSTATSLRNLQVYIFDTLGGNFVSLSDTPPSAWQESVNSLNGGLGVSGDAAVNSMTNAGGVVVAQMYGGAFGGTENVYVDAIQFRVLYKDWVTAPSTLDIAYSSSSTSTTSYWPTASTTTAYSSSAESASSYNTLLNVFTAYSSAGSSASAYLPRADASATYTNLNTGAIEYTPRADALATYSSSAASDTAYTALHQALLSYNSTASSTIARRNLFTYTEDFRGTIEAGVTRPWGQFQGLNTTVITDGSVVAPNGKPFVSKLVAEDPGAGAVQRQVFQSVAGLADNTNFTLSVFAKAGEANTISIAASTKTPRYPSVDFNLVSGTVLATNAAGSTIVASDIVDVGDGWYRCWATFNTETGASTPGVNYQIKTNTGWFNPTGPNQGLYVWGAQLDVGGLTNYQRVTSAFTDYNYQALALNSYFSSSESLISYSTGAEVELTPVNYTVSSTSASTYVLEYNAFVAPSSTSSLELSYAPKYDAYKTYLSNITGVITYATDAVVELTPVNYTSSSSSVTSYAAAYFAFKTYSNTSTLSVSHTGKYDAGISYLSSSASGVAYNFDYGIELTPVNYTSSSTSAQAYTPTYHAFTSLNSSSSMSSAYRVTGAAAIGYSMVSNMVVSHAPRFGLNVGYSFSATSASNYVAQALALKSMVSEGSSVVAYATQRAASLRYSSASALDVGYAFIATAIAAYLSETASTSEYRLIEAGSFTSDVLQCTVSYQEWIVENGVSKPVTRTKTLFVTFREGAALVVTERQQATLVVNT